MSMYDLLHTMKGDSSSFEKPTDHDLSHLAEWANEMVVSTPNPSWKRAYALIREGADLLLRRRAMSRVPERGELDTACDGAVRAYVDGVCITAKSTAEVRS